MFKQKENKRKKQSKNKYTKRSSRTKIKQLNPARTKSGKIPQGRTLSTYDNFLPGGKKTGSRKERPVVVIEASDNNDLAVVPLSSRNGQNRTHLPNYQQGQSYFKHYVEIEDDEGKPIRVNEKFRENHPKMDVSGKDVTFIKDTVFNHSKPKQKNNKHINKFRGK